MFSTALGRVRALGIAEAISFVALLGLAMPLKYFADQTLGVRILGPVHGLLFVALVAALLHARWMDEWPIKRCAIVFVACLLPFGPLAIDGWLRRQVSADGTGAPGSVAS